MTATAAAYLRVSTVRQADGQLSLPDQRRQIEDHCRRQGYDLVAVFEDAATGTDADRPGLQDLLARALDRSHPFDVVAVHSFSRLGREGIETEMMIRRLEKKRVKVVSVTQDLPDDEAGRFLRVLLAQFDAYQSAENGKHTLRAMKENTRQGYWNGSHPPFGYTVVDAGVLGARAKKKPRIDEARAPLVAQMYGMILHGTDGHGPMGLKAIAAWLNDHGHTTGSGGPFTHKAVHDILTDPVYTGVLTFNRRYARTKALKPEQEHVTTAVPAIVVADLFDRVQATLASRAPRRTPPRTVGSATLLAGLGRCGHCRDGLVLATGKSGKYRYYCCARRHRQGLEACPGCRVPADALDGAVVEAVLARVLAPDRLEALRAALAERLAAEAEAGDTRRALAVQRDKARQALDNLYAAIESGALDPADAGLAERLRAAGHRRDEAEHHLAALDARRTLSLPATPAVRERLAAFLRSALETGDPAFRRAFVRLHVAAVTVIDGTVTIDPI